MSSLAVSVGLLALVAIVVVAGYNLWLGRSRLRRAPRAEPPSREDPAAAGARGEPSLGLDDGASDEAAGAEPAAAAGTAGARAPGATLDPDTDCIVELQLLAPIPGERVISLTRSLRRVGSKPVLVEAATPEAFAAELGARQATELARARGEPGDDPAPAQHAVGNWQVPSAGMACGAVRLGVLLANRHGALNAMEFSEFVAGVQSIADQLSVLADTPDMSAVLARARALDELCASLDAQVGIAVEADDPLGVADLERLARETGCVERGNNRYARLGSGGEVLFSLALADNPNRLSLLLDVPRAPSAQSPWREMLECARTCAQRLGGRLVDEAGRPLPDAHLERIEQQIVARLQSLDDAGLPAGAPLTLRLFN